MKDHKMEMMKSLITLTWILLSFSVSRPAFSEDDPPKTIEHKIVGKLVLIPKGEFLMGSKEDEPDARADERPQHKVVIEKPFYMGAYEITFDQFRHFVAATGYLPDSEKYHKATGYDSKIHDVHPNPSFTWRDNGFKDTGLHPVGNVSWNDAVAFCRWLTNEDGKHIYRLPTEVEWEYAARAGSRTEYCWGNSTRSLRFRENVADRSYALVLSQVSKNRKVFAKWTDKFPFTSPVGSFRRNKFGLFDTHGNVQEWCQDLYDKDSYLKPKNFKPLIGDERVTRGGTCFYSLEACRVARRNSYSPQKTRSEIGFRIVRDVK